MARSRSLLEIMNKSNRKPNSFYKRAVDQYKSITNFEYKVSKEKARYKDNWDNADSETLKQAKIIGVLLENYKKTKYNFVNKDTRQSLISFFGRN